MFVLQKSRGQETLVIFGGESGIQVFRLEVTGEELDSLKEVLVVSGM